VAFDATEFQLLALAAERPAKVVLGLPGGHGILLGRGNQQIGPRLIERVGKENFVVIASLAKLASLDGAPLAIDTGDPHLDCSLSGYLPVRTGPGQAALVRLATPRDEAKPFDS
jgi:predicted polyphosphate/ATP-dependent NAD kinase